MQFLIILLFITGLLLLWLAARQRRAAGLPAGRVIYADTRYWGKVEKPLYDPISSLTGKPDYLVKQSSDLLPVEVKSRSASQVPYDSHILQLAAYCLLVERVFRMRPPYGILHYPNRTFAIDYTPELESALLDLVARMHGHQGNQELHRSHHSPARCKGCGYRQICDQALK